MSHLRSGPAAGGRWKRPFYIAVVVAAVVIVMIAWFRTPVVQAESEDAEGGFSTLRCANAGPSRWDPPTVSESQDVDPSSTMVTFNQQVIHNQIESLRVSAACDQARDAHSNNLMVTTFGAALVLFFGYHALWERRSRAEPSEEPVAS